MQDMANTTGQVALFRRHSSYAQADREFVDWRKAFTFLLLISCPIPSKDQKRTFFDQLTESADPETGLIDIKTFLKVTPWFEKYEATTISGNRTRTMSAALSSQQDS